MLRGRIGKTVACVVSPTPLHTTFTNKIADEAADRRIEVTHTSAGGHPYQGAVVRRTILGMTPKVLEIHSNLVHANPISFPIHISIHSTTIRYQHPLDILYSTKCLIVEASIMI